MEASMTMSRIPVTGDDPPGLSGTPSAAKLFGR
jgi:hypothetical protein